RAPSSTLFPYTTLFRSKQDVELGSESAKEAEQSLALVRDLNTDGYFRGIGQRLSQNPTLPALKYRFQIVNSKEVNSLGFPGGARSEEHTSELQSLAYLV